MIKHLVLAASLAIICEASFAQQTLTRDQILAMTTDQLSELPLEELMAAVETLGVSSVDELFALIMNKNVSSASKKEEDSFKSPLSSTVITRNELKTYGISTIEEAFRLIPGMIVQEKTNGVYDVQMRGLNNIPDNNLLLYTENNNILVLIDGRVAHSYANGAPFFEMLPIAIEDVERIEVVRGAASALYGPNAVNGVVNIITTKPDQSDFTVSGNMQVGNHTMVGGFALQKPINQKIGVGLTANMQQRNRGTNTIPFIPQTGSYIVNDASALNEDNSYTYEELATLIATGVLTDVSDGADLTLDQISKLMSVYTSDYTTYNLYEFTGEGVDLETQYGEIDLARRSGGINGYLTLTPNTKTRIDLTGGYQYSRWKTNPIGTAYLGFLDRKSKTGYVAANASIGDLHVLANYWGGEIDFSIGFFGFLLDEFQSVNAEAEYDINVGEHLTIRPGLSFQYNKYFCSQADSLLLDDGTYEELSNFFGYASKEYTGADLYNFSPSVRLDYQKNGLRLIGAFRGDRTNIPDKWTPSWQCSASYSLNDKNFIRFVYGRAARSATFMNTSSNHCINRTNLSNPHYLQFIGNEDASLMHIDNFELGYRVKLFDKLLVDLEAFYSLSQDYGMLKAYSSSLNIAGSDMLGALYGIFDGSITLAQLPSMVGEAFDTKSYIRYDELPFKVKQMGLSVNVDWIISKKLIAKLNANLQQTRIDNYYEYNQNSTIAQQLTQSYKQTITDGGLTDLITELLTGITQYIMAGKGTPQDYMALCTGQNNTVKYRTAYNAMSDSEKETYLAALKEAGESGTSYGNITRPLEVYYGLKYNIDYDEISDEYYFGVTLDEEKEYENNHKHKATPSVYGMLGLIYKPISELSISAFANFMSSREYSTTMGTVKLDPNCTVNLKIGYSPIENCEIFFNAHNLFNSNKKEFIYADKSKGIYTVGVNFGF